MKLKKKSGVESVQKDSSLGDWEQPVLPWCNGRSTKKQEMGSPSRETQDPEFVTKLS